jgi:hypothetical protein
MALLWEWLAVTDRRRTELGWALAGSYQVTPSVLERDGRQDPSVSPVGDIKC